MAGSSLLFADKHLGGKDALLVVRAEISIWVKAASKKEALKKARAHIRAEGWSFVHTDDLYAAKRDDFDDPASLTCYDEAEADGLSLIFYTWPADQ